MTYALLMLAAFAAGFIDAVVGGGGLIQLPALLYGMPGLPVSVAAGTNKSASVFGTLSAIPHYARHVQFNTKFLACTLPAAFVCAFLGANTLAWLDSPDVAKKYMKPLILVLLIAVAIYTYTKKTLGDEHREHPLSGAEYMWAALVCGAIGFYDGFFGPGTGSFLIFAMIRFLGFNFLHSTAYAKFVNAATNLGALAYFIPHGKVLFAIGLPMAAFNIMGATLGARTAVLRGNRFVRVLFLAIVAAVIARLGWDVAIGK